jgi:hypothetical protein
LYRFGDTRGNLDRMTRGIDRKNKDGKPLADLDGMESLVRSPRHGNPRNGRIDVRSRELHRTRARNAEEALRENRERIHPADLGGLDGDRANCQLLAWLSPHEAIQVCRPASRQGINQALKENS